MKKGERVTIIDVARVAQTTPQTVSRALRNAPDISESTRKRILRIAADMNYVKNNIASSLRRGNSGLIAVIYDNVINLYFSVMINYLQFCLKDYGYSILTSAILETKLGREAYLSAVSHNVDGIISFIEPNEDVSALIEQHGVPVLLFGRRTDVPHVDCIYGDDVTGGEIGARALLQCGCKRPAFLSESLEITCAYDRFQGMKNVTAENGLPDPQYIYVHNENLGEHLKTALADLQTSPDGFFCFNDMIAFELQEFFEKNGIPPVPVVGYDDVQSEIRIPGRLTTVGLNKRLFAERAADILLNRIRHSDAKATALKEEVFLVKGETA
ncbi:MAG: LacI family DNA-binding transcriptional regulator [Clostridia bacterium]|nr:LacI family DNA-binding transcriptional regulator [Clostridia bacterium]